MTVYELLDQAYRLGARFIVPEPGRVRVEASEPLPYALMVELRRHKAEVLEALALLPSDATDLIDIWKLLDCPAIPLRPGASISNLERWFSPLHGLPPWEAEELAMVRRFLLEYLPPSEVPEVDHVLEEWRRTSIPFWKARLGEAEASGDSRVSSYAAWMLEVLGEDF